MTTVSDKLDALALIRAELEVDEGATAVILGHADLRAVAEAVAEVAAVLLVKAFRGHDTAERYVQGVQRGLAALEAEAGS